MFTMTTVEQYTRLSDSEQKALAQFEHIYQHGSLEEKEQLEHALKFYSPETVFKFSEKSPLFKHYAEHSLDHKKEWIAYLQDCGYPGYDFDSLDRTKKCSTFAQYVGSFLFYASQNNQTTNPALAAFLLNKACQYGSLFALTERCEENLLIVMDEDTSDTKKTVALGQINNDLHLLSNLYWTLGAAFACRTYLNLASYYADSGNDHFTHLVHAHYKMAIKSFCTAEILSKEKISQTIIHYIVQDENFFAYIFNIPYHDWQDAKENYILPFIKGDQTFYNEMNKQAKTKIINMRAPKNAS